jgi:hypothetical protein
LRKRVFHDILKVLKLTIIKQKMHAVLIPLTPGRRKKLIDCQKAKVRIAVLPIMDGKTDWTSTLEMLEDAFRLQEFTRD